MSQVFPFLYTAHFDDPGGSSDDYPADWWSSAVVLSESSDSAQAVGDLVAKAYVESGRAGRLLDSQVLPMVDQLVALDGVRSQDWGSLTVQALKSLFLGSADLPSESRELVALVAAPSSTEAKQAWKQFVDVSSVSGHSRHMAAVQVDFGLLRAGDPVPSDWDTIGW